MDQTSGNMKKKVVLVERIFSFYRKPIFDLFSEEVDFKLFHGNNRSGIKSGTAPYAEEIPFRLFGQNKDTKVTLFPLRKIMKFRPDVVITDFALGILNLPLIILGCKLLGIKTAFWSHGYDRKIGFKPKERMSDKYRLFMLKWVDANIVYGKEDKGVLSEYLDPNTIFVAQNTLDTNSFGRIRDKLAEEGKEAIKQRLGIKHQYNIIFIGRMLPDKNPELLVKMYDVLKEKYNLTIGVHFIGKGPMVPELEQMIKERGVEEDFYMHGAIYDDVKNGEFLFVSDLMVMPGYLGLSVNHALCFDCPVLSFATIDGYPAHSPEVEYVVQGKTGWLLNEHTPEAMAETAHELFSNPDLQAEINRNIRHDVLNVFPIEKMVGGAVACVEYLTRK